MSSNKLKQIEFKRLLKRYESSLEDLEYLKEMASEINSDFNSALASKERHDLFESKEIKDMSEEPVKEKELDGDRGPLFKKLFRKIVVKCHPDRMDPDLSIKQQAELLEYYDTATNANDDNNMALLITVAIKLEIELSDDYFEHIEKIREEVAEAKKTFIKYKWPTIDVTRKSVEEVAASVIKIHEIYKNNV